MSAFQQLRQSQALEKEVENVSRHKRILHIFYYS